MQTDNALIVVDYQNSFIPENEWGTWELWVEGWWLLAPRINQLMQETRQKWGLVIATRDWHPQGHMSFASNYAWKNPFDTVWWDEVMNNVPEKVRIENSADFNLTDLQIEFWAKWNQVLWPDHCVQETAWADYHKDLDISQIDRHILKWYDPKTEMYSWFFGREDTLEWKTLTEILKEFWVKTVRVIGLATDYCVSSTAADAVRNGFHTIIDRSAIAWVAIKSPEDTIKYLEELREKQSVEFE